MISGLKTKGDREGEIGVQEFRERERDWGLGFKERDILKVKDLERDIGLGV